MNREQYENFCSANCLNCHSCCENFPLFYEKDGKIVKAKIRDKNKKIRVPFSKKTSLNKIPNCYYLKDGKCEIYKKRPKICRDYICDLLNILKLSGGK